MKRSLWGVVTVLVVLALWGGTAWADEAAGGVAGLLDYVLGLVGVALVSGIVYVAKWLAARLKIQVSAEREDLLRKAAKAAVYYVEETAKRKLKLSGLAMTAEEKAALGVKRLLTVVGGKVPGVNPREAVERVHEALGSVLGLGASKGTGDA